MSEHDPNEQKKNPRGSSPPDVAPGRPQDHVRRSGGGIGWDENGWTAWQAAYRLRRKDTLLRILGPVLKRSA